MAKSYILRAKLAEDKRVYRDIKISSSASLFALAKEIVGAFGFDFDHMCGFYQSLKNPYADKGKAYTMFADMPEMRGENPSDLSIKKHKVSDLWQEKKDTWQFVFDYGDDWRFLVELIESDDETTAKPVVVKSAGQAPEQYPDLDEESDEDENDEHACPLCSREDYEETMGINQPRRKGEDETLFSLLLLFRHDDKYLALLPDIPEADSESVGYIFPFVPQTQATLEESVEEYCRQFGVTPEDWRGLRPFTMSAGEGKVILAAPYLIDIATPQIQLETLAKAVKWLTPRQLEDEPFAPFIGPLLDELDEVDAV